MPYLFYHLSLGVLSALKNVQPNLVGFNLWCDIMIVEKPTFLNFVLVCSYKWYEFLLWSSITRQKHGAGALCRKNENFHMAWQAIVKWYHSTFIEGFLSYLVQINWKSQGYIYGKRGYKGTKININMYLSARTGQFVTHIIPAMEIIMLLWTGCNGTKMNNYFDTHWKTVKHILFDVILDAIFKMHQFQSSWAV